MPSFKAAIRVLLIIKKVPYEVGEFSGVDFGERTDWDLIRILTPILRSSIFVVVYFIIRL